MFCWAFLRQHLPACLLAVILTNELDTLHLSYLRDPGDVRLWLTLELDMSFGTISARVYSTDARGET